MDIDLFTDAAYGSVDFKAITRYLRSSFPYVDTTDYAEVGFGQTYFIGQNEQHAVKLDLFYTDAFIRPALLIDCIRLAHVEDIIAMKMDVVARGGRRKDFWDLHELLDSYPVDKMIAFHKERYPYSHDDAAIRKQLTDFAEADNDFEPVCLRGKHWEFVKLDIISAMRQ